SYHSHDSLLENRLDEGLSADEKKIAIEEYENLQKHPDHYQQRLTQQHLDQKCLNEMIQRQYMPMMATSQNPSLLAATTTSITNPYLLTAHDIFQQLLGNIRENERVKFDMEKLAHYAYNQAIQLKHERQIHLQNNSNIPARQQETDHQLKTQRYDVNGTIDLSSKTVHPQNSTNNDNNDVIMLDNSDDEDVTSIAV
ncbi:unnamed protein product, partial [Didymodactylos carnosus]